MSAPGRSASAPRFHVAREAADPAWRAGDTFALPETAVHHALRVLRLGTGDALTLFDGAGGEWRARIERADRHTLLATLEHFEAIERELPVSLTLAQALIAADAMDPVVRKAVELGVAAVVPLIAARTQGTLRGDKAARRLTHWRRIALAACEQCGRNRVPMIAEPIAFDAWCAEQSPRTALLAPGATLPLATWSRAAGDSATVAVGPEGGWTEAELARADVQGIARTSLGPTILRADTAAIAALAVQAAMAG
jgi:16S rRNA (uracil1498-N3)-methyltransferase